jgi:hypothetical protein
LALGQTGRSAAHGKKVHGRCPHLPPTRTRNEDDMTMLIVTDKASEELQKILASDQAKGKGLVLYYQGAG